jgi:hypothetical protein
MWMCVALVLAQSLIAWTSATAGPAEPISAEEAVKSVGKPEVLVQMKVATAKDRVEKRGIVYLDSEPDFKDPKNLGVAISAAAAEQFKKQGISDLASHFQGKTIRVRGCVMRFEERPYLPVLDAGQIKIVAEK